MSQEVRPLLELVDLFIAHPQDDDWWTPILRAYIKQRPDEVRAHIRARNRTRELRKAPTTE